MNRYSGDPLSSLQEQIHDPLRSVKSRPHCVFTLLLRLVCCDLGVCVLLAPRRWSVVVHKVHTLFIASYPQNWSAGWMIAVCERVLALEGYCIGSRNLS